MKHFILSAIFVFCSAFIDVDNSVQVKLNGVQIFVHSAKNNEETALLFKELKSKNVNVVMFRVFHNVGDRAHMNISSECESGVYFKTNKACVMNDLLTEIVSIAKTYDIKVFAWMATRSLSFLKTGENISKSISPDGKIVDGYGANIFNESVRSDILQLFADLSKYDIDGILFQDDFIIKYNEGADNLTADLFYKDTGLKTNADTFFNGVKSVNGKQVFSGFKDEFYIWATWKNKQLMKFFQEIRDVVKAENPNIMLAANVYYESPIQPKNALAWYSQDLSALKDAGADYFAVMGYGEQIADELGLGEIETANIIREIALNATKIMGDNSKVIMKLQTKSFKTGKKIRKSTYMRIYRKLASINNLSIVVVPVSSADDLY